MIRPKRLSLLGCGLLLSILPCSAQTVDDVFPLEPEDGSTVGTRPLLKIGVEGTDVPSMRFRIVLSQDAFDTESYVFNQQEEKNGWALLAYDGENGAVYYPRRPLEDGFYEWKVYAWNGVDWVEGETIYRLNVDGTPPAAVENLRLRAGENGAVRLDWDPVTIDREGRPEYVTRYHVYRYEKRTVFFNIRAFEIGVTEETRFVDDTPKALAAGLLFYKVTAEDAAGNHPRRWYTAERKSSDD